MPIQSKDLWRPRMVRRIKKTKTMEKAQAAKAIKRDSNKTREKKEMAKTAAILLEQARATRVNSLLMDLRRVEYRPAKAKIKIQRQTTGRRKARYLSRVRSKITGRRA